MQRVLVFALLIQVLVLCKNPPISSPYPTVNTAPDRSLLAQDQEVLDPKHPSLNPYKGQPFAARALVENSSASTGTHDAISTDGTTNTNSIMESFNDVGDGDLTLAQKLYFDTFAKKNEISAQMGWIVPYEQILGKNFSKWTYEQTTLGADIIDLSSASRFHFTYDPQGAPPLPQGNTAPRLFLGMLPSDDVLDLYRKKGGERNYDKIDLDHFRAVSVVMDYEFQRVSAQLKKDNRDYQIRTPDNVPVPIFKLREGVIAIDLGLASGSDVYVHCKSGVGRSASVVASWLIQHYHMSAMAAATLVKEHRPEVVIGTPGVYHQLALEDFEVALRMKGKIQKDIEKDQSILDLLHGYGIALNSDRYTQILQGSTQL